MRHTKELYRYRQNLGCLLLSTLLLRRPLCVTGGGVKASTPTACSALVGKPPVCVVHWM